MTDGRTCLRMDREMYDAIVRIAERDGISVSEVIRRAIRRRCSQ